LQMALHLQINFSTIRNDELVKSLLLPVFEISAKPAPVNGHLKVSHLRSKKMSHTDSFYNPPLSLLPALPFNL